ncbi:MAG: hypothetical protein ACOC8N_08425 [Spirochaetota bacterium]
MFNNKEAGPGRTFIVLIVLGLVLGAAADTVHAHRVHVFAYVENGTVHTESYAQDGSAVKGGLIQVYDGDGELVHRGETDESGMHSFPVPARGRLTIVLDASMGHRADFTLETGEPAMTTGRSEAAVGGETARDEPDGKREPGGADSGAGPGRQVSGVELEDIRAMVREEVSAQLAPLLRQAALEGRDRITASEVFAGIGYILGLAGIALLVYSRKGSGSKR